MNNKRIPSPVIGISLFFSFISAIIPKELQIPGKVPASIDIPSDWHITASTMSEGRHLAGSDLCPGFAAGISRSKSTMMRIYNCGLESEAEGLNLRSVLFGKIFPGKIEFIGDSTTIHHTQPVPWQAWTLASGSASDENGEVIDFTSLVFTVNSRIGTVKNHKYKPTTTIVIVCQTKKNSKEKPHCANLFDRLNLSFIKKRKE